MNKYYIKIWETEIDREEGISFKYDKYFKSKDKAIQKAKEIFRDESCASIEVVNQNDDLFYFQDKEEETIFIENIPISKVDTQTISNYIDCWLEGKTLPISRNMLYCEENNKFISIDNSTGACFVENFDYEEDAQKWLLGKNKENDKNEDFVL